MKIRPSEKMQELGRRLAINGHVLGVHPHEADQAWYAKINDREVCHVKLDASAEKNDVCTCQDWVKFGVCRHICATEYYLQMQGHSRFQIKEAALAKQVQQKKKPSNNWLSLSDFLLNNLHAVAEKTVPNLDLVELESLTLEVCLEEISISQFLPEKNLLGLSLRIGVQDERQFRVKKMSEFFEAYQWGQRYQLNKARTVTLCAQCFSQTDQELLNYLYEMYRSDRLLQSVEGNQLEAKLEKYILLPSLAIEDLLERLNSYPYFSYKIGEFQGKELKMSETANIIDFYVDLNEDQAVLKDFTWEGSYFSHYQWIILKDTLVYLTDYQDAIFQILIELQRKATNGRMVFAGDDLQQLFLTVIPAISEIGEVHFSKEDGSEYPLEELKTTVFFDLDEQENYLTVESTYRYGAVVLSSNPERQIGTQQEAIVRDQYGEQQLEHLFDYFHYRKDHFAYIKLFPKGEDRYAFFTKELAAYRKIAEVHVSPRLQHFFIDDLTEQPKITVKENSSWLDIEFDISSVEEEEVQKVMEAIVAEKPFVELQNGQLLDLEDDAFSKTAQALKRLRERITLNDKGFRIKSYHGMELNNQFSYMENIQFQEEFAKMVKDLKTPEEFPVEVPSRLQADLREYQKIGFRWMKMLSHHHFGGILADDMGLGKTLQTISFLLSEKEDEVLKLPALIVVPTSLIYNWEIECQKFAPQLKVLVVSGSKEVRRDLLKNYEDYDIVITSYGSFRSDSLLYQKRHFQFLILDEAQTIKNSLTKTYASLKSLEVEQRFALTGTPIENNLEELWAIFELLMPGFFPNKTKFKKMTPKEVGQMIRPFVLRREKKTVLKDLPDKMEMNLYNELTDEQKVVYIANLENMQRQVLSMDSATLSKSKISILSGLTRLRQVCCDPSLFLNDYQGSSGKLEQLKELMTTAQESGRRVLIFSQFTTMLSKIKQELETMGLSTFYLHGRTPAKERIQMVEWFNEGQGDAFLVSLKAGGTGLNLTGADTVILYDLWWNPAVEEQAASRAHRIGQKKVVEVWRLITKGTIEEKIYQLQQDKKELFQKVISEEQEVALKRLTEEDIRQILSIGAEDGY